MGMIFVFSLCGVCNAEYLSQGVYHMDSSEQMRRRPMAPLLDSLAELGCEVSYEGSGAER